MKETIEFVYDSLNKCEYEALVIIPEQLGDLLDNLQSLLNSPSNLYLHLSNPQLFNFLQSLSHRYLNSLPNPVPLFAGIYLGMSPCKHFNLSPSHSMSLQYPSPP